MKVSEFFPFWAQLSPPEQQLLENAAVTRHYEKGEIIHDGTQDCTGLLLLEKGQMRAFTVTEEGRELTLFRMLPGEICMFSGYCAVSSIPFPITVEAWEPCQVWVIPAAVYRQLMDTSLPVSFGHSNAPEAMEACMAYFAPKTAGAQLCPSDIGAVVGTHVGPGATGLAYFVKKA